MRRSARCLCILLLTTSIILTGCTDNNGDLNPVAPLPSYSISIDGLPEVLSAPEGYIKDLAFSVKIIDNGGESAYGVLVDLSVISGSGTVTPSGGLTDTAGRFYSTLSLEMPERDGRVQIIVAAGSGDAIVSLILHGTPRPEAIRLMAEAYEISIIDRQAVEVSVTAVVTNSSGEGVPGVDLDFDLVAPPGMPRFGTISQPAPTNNEGRTTITFNNLGGTGRMTISCSHTIPGEIDITIQQTISLNFSLLASRVGTLTAVAVPDYHNLAVLDTAYESTITVQVSDQEGRAIPGLRLDATTNLGAVSPPALTDQNGITTSLFRIIPSADLEPGEHSANVVFAVPATAITESVTIQLRQSSQEHGSLRLFSDRRTIYADYGVTRANLIAVLKNADGEAMEGKEIRFSSNHGAVNSPVITDSLGLARAVFSDIGLPSEDPQGNPEPAIIYANYGFGDNALEGYVEVTIVEHKPIILISLMSGAQQLIAGRGDSTAVTAILIQENGERGVDGVEVTFTAEIGWFRPNRVNVRGGIGAAESYYFSGQRSGTDRLQAYVVNADGDTTFSNVVLVTLLPGSPSRVTVTAFPNQLPTGDPTAFSNVTATVRDTVGNAVIAGTLVRFTTTLGQITESAITDTTGKATVRLTPGIESGFATVTAVVYAPWGPITGQTTVQFYAGSPNSIELRASPHEINIAGVGGIESATLFATVRDPNGNPVGGVVPVYFELIRQPAEPRGCNINRHGQLDSAFTQNGLARATLNAGTQSGGVLVRAYTWRDPETRLQRVDVVNSTVSVSSGPPELVDVDVDSRGIDAGGGGWELEVSARIFDVFRNPVNDGLIVMFTLEPDLATIDNGVTGNQNRLGESFPGMAYAPMIYNSDNSFDTLEITAIIETEESQRVGRIEYTLPLQRGELQLNVSPVNYMFDRERPNDVADITCWAILRDGHGRLINNGPVLFTTTRGYLWYRDFRGQYIEFVNPNPAIKYTGWRPPRHPDYYEPDGTATVYLRGVMDDYFLDPFTLEISVRIGASVVGYDQVVARPQYVMMTRH